MGLLSAEIANEASPAHVRQSAALALKNQLTAKVYKVLIFFRVDRGYRNKRDGTSIKRNGLL